MLAQHENTTSHIAARRHAVDPRNRVCGRIVFLDQRNEIREVISNEIALENIGCFNFLKLKLDVKDHTGKAHASTGRMKKVGVLCPAAGYLLTGVYHQREL